jgi:UDP-N-acetylmuramoyl-tripeptide--D-alanyl-D-alanine ligase
MSLGPLQLIVNACAGELLSGSPAARVRRVCTDSRQVQEGDLFFALPGPRFDGHDFLLDVAAKGAAAVVVERSRAPAALHGCSVIGVDDTRKALGRLAARHRANFTLPVVAVGGSNGKTTTKDLVAAVLRQKFTTLASEASFNNDIGVPLTLLNLRQTHQAAILEAGTNHPGELAPLVRMIRPDYGIITNIGREHLEFLGDLAGVASEEGSLAELLPPNGKLFVNGDDAWTDPIVQRARCPVVRVGSSDTNQWRLSDPRSDDQGVTFQVDGPVAGFAGKFRINLLGRHQAVNALFAVALGAELGLGPDQVAQGLLECKPAKMRLQLSKLNGVRLLDDAYNANADSVLAALQTLHDLPCKGRRVAVLGDMAELGAHSLAAHEEVGRNAAELGIGQLFAVGTMAAAVANGARSAGLNRVFEFADVETAASAVKSFLKDGDLVLLKASRAARLERIAERLRMAYAAKGK